MESVIRARERLAKYPVVFAKCSKQGTLYARCVLLKEGSVKHNDCAKEFEQFKTCLTSAAKDLKTRI
ncbi:NADH dehydrogenase [ubiquinone] 1 alpha subcomplex assembly factor 8 [Anticarsia gemmatalis]|uniref:NADH dehydrogenase [ubiquinone] 1 alpha subcomplex assembly factor 8 n=1 Tax=Anticarsia gemmatalis TaxID=129554 RepID=UPI003F76B0ED